MRTTSWACRRMKLSRSVLLGQVFFLVFWFLFCIAGVFLTYTVSSRPLRITRTLGSVVYYNFFHVSVYKGSEDLL